MPSALPNTLEGFRNFHHGDTIVVCGCGKSLAGFADHEQYITIGVNDVGRLFQPTYLVVLNHRAQFSGERFDHVARSSAKALFTQLNLGINHPHIVRFNLGRQNGVTFDTPDVLPYARNSPYVAMCLAALMGAKRIGLIGIDFTDDHFFGRTGRHPLTTQLAAIDQQYQRLEQALRARGVSVVNLSSESRLTAFRKGHITELHGPETGQTMRPCNGASAIAAQTLKIVSYATTPVAGVPAILARCISAATPHEARCVWARNDYGNGVVFDGDVEWTRSPAEADQLMDSADLVIVHNGKVEPRHRRLLAGKPIITMAHNYISNVDCGFVDTGFPGVVVGQYQATLPEFAAWSVVPNPVPLWEPAYRPEPKPDVVTIAYTPSGRHESYPPGHRLYWHGKGYNTTMAVLDALTKRYPVNVVAIRDRQVSHGEALAAKRRAHIVIDECVTGSYHRNSLEGLACGCVVINGVGRLGGVADVLSRCALDGRDMPFVQAGLDSLDTALASLIESGPVALEQAGQRSRAWIESHWDFARQWDLFWRPHVEKALATFRLKRTASPLALPPSRPPAIGIAATNSISVIVPHGGAERKPLLRACLERLKQHRVVGEIIVAEMDAAPNVRDVAAELGAGYVFIGDQGIFHKARTINVALPLASHELLLWLDNDLILPAEFLERALGECEERSLDCLIPWTSVRYLSADDTVAVIQGEAAATSCRPVQTFWSRRGACGGAVLVRRDFGSRYGGLCEEFRGWGGEDNAWYHKARVLGRAAVTARTDQHLYHLYHPRSGGYGREQPGDRNPGYAMNVALLNEVRRLTSANRFLARFPSPASAAPPWSVRPRFDISYPDEGGHVSEILQTLPAALADAYGPEEHSDGAAIVAIHLSCENPAGPGQPVKVIMRRPAENGGEAREELWLDDESGCADAKSILKTFIGPLSVLLADVQPEGSTLGNPDGSRQPFASGASPAMKLNLGCCDALLDGHVNVDIIEAPGVQVADLRKPWPWRDCSVDFIRAHDIIEHLPDKIFTMNEMWRVLEPGCEAEIVVPTTDGPGAFQDPTHVSFWHRRSFMYYESDNPYRERFARSYGILARFRIMRERIDMTRDGPKLTIVLAAVK